MLAKPARDVDLLYFIGVNSTVQEFAAVWHELERIYISMGPGSIQTSSMFHCLNRGTRGAVNVQRESNILADGLPQFLSLFPSPQSGLSMAHISFDFVRHLGTWKWTSLRQHRIGAFICTKALLCSPIVRLSQLTLFG